MRIRYWISDGCSSDLANGSLSWSATWVPHAGWLSGEGAAPGVRHEPALEAEPVGQPESDGCLVSRSAVFDQRCAGGVSGEPVIACQNRARDRSEEHTSELQSLMRISYAVFCLQKKKPYTVKAILTQHHLTD